jgi:hypothetical protein
LFLPIWPSFFLFFFLLLKLFLFSISISSLQSIFFYVNFDPYFFDFLGSFS